MQARWNVLLAVLGALGAAGCGSGGSTLGSQAPPTSPQIQSVQSNAQTMDRAVRDGSEETYRGFISENYADSTGLLYWDVRMKLDQWQSIRNVTWTVGQRSVRLAPNGQDVLETTQGTLHFFWVSDGSAETVPLDYVETWRNERGTWRIVNVESPLGPGVGRMFDPFPSALAQPVTAE
jgi:hypothetical protein